MPLYLARVSKGNLYTALELPLLSEPRPARRASVLLLRRQSVPNVSKRHISYIVHLTIRKGLTVGADRAKHSYMIQTRKRTSTHTRALGSGESGERESAKPFRAALPALDIPSAASAKPDLEQELQVFRLVSAVAQDDGMLYPPEWIAIADAAKRAGYLRETGLRLYITELGSQWLGQREGTASEPGVYTMTKINSATRYALKKMSKEVGLPMQEVITHVIDSLYDNRDALTREARRQGLTYPWEVVGRLAKGSK